MVDKLSKTNIINSINYYYLQQGLLCENLNKISKDKLIEIIKTNNIEIVDIDKLKNDILKIERYNYLRDIIYCNYIKYDIIPYNDVKNITLNTPNYELEEIINKYELKYDSNYKNIKELVFNIYKVYNKYCKKSNIKNDCEYITLPCLLNNLKEISTYSKI
jgi:hypothetical protein